MTSLQLYYSRNDGLHRQSRTILVHRGGDVKSINHISLFLRYKVGFMMIDRARALPVPVRVCGTAFDSFGGRWNKPLSILSFLSHSYPFLILLILSTNLTFYTLKLSANVFFTLPCLGHVYFPFTQCREPHAKAKPAVGRIPTQIYLNLRSTLRLLALLTSHSVTTQTIQNIHTSLPAETSSRK